MIKRGGCIFFLIFCSYAPFAQTAKHHWVDSIFNSLSLEKKIGQLFFIAVPANATAQQLQAIANFAKDGKAGGVVQQQSSLSTHVKWTQQLQREAKVPVLVAARVTAGLGSVLDSTMHFFEPVVLGAVEDENLTHEYGLELTRQMILTGIHLNLATYSPAVYSDDRDKNISRTTSFFKSLTDGGRLTNMVLDSDADSALSPTKELIATSLSSIQFSLMGKQKASEFDLTQLRSKLSFEGLLLADANELQKFSAKKKKGDSERIGFTSGFDAVINSTNLDAAIRQIKKVLKKDKSKTAQLENSVRRILSAKYDAGLAQVSPPASNLKQKLFSPEAKLLKQSIANQSITVVQNGDNTIPIQKLDDQIFASVSIGSKIPSTFTQYLSKYCQFFHFQASDEKNIPSLTTGLARADVIVVGLFQKSVSKELADYIVSLSKTKQVVVCGFNDPSQLVQFKDLSTLIAAYSDDEEILQSTAEIIFGGLPAVGTLSRNIGDAFACGTKVQTSTTNRFAYQLPEVAGMDSRVLEKIELIANEAIAIGATPGCYVQVVKDGKVIYDRGFGHLTYEKKSPVTDQTIYDLASVTKVTATLQTVMYMYEKGTIDVYKKLSAYLPELKESNKADFTIKDILTHQAGLWPFLPFWAETVKDSAITQKYYSHQPTEDYPFPVAENLFATRVMKDSLWQWIIKAKVREKTSRTPYDYKYSDMGFYMLQRLAEKVLHMPMEDFLQKNIYQPIGASTMGYLPLRKFQMVNVAPTEDDKLFRKELLVGYVHDQGAAMHGGVAGHAGLFSNANDLAKMGQLWLNGGTYGGVHFLKPETLSFFTQKQYETSRRGLGWDRPTISYWDGPTSYHASAKTFGHTGFTGTCVWVDPEFNLVYVFLSNRVNPDMTNNKILNANIRPRIQEVIYQSIFEYCSRSER